MHGCSSGSCTWVWDFLLIFYFMHLLFLAIFWFLCVSLYMHLSNSCRMTSASSLCGSHGTQNRTRWQGKWSYLSGGILGKELKMLLYWWSFKVHGFSFISGDLITQGMAPLLYPEALADVMKSCWNCISLRYWLCFGPGQPDYNHYETPTSESWMLGPSYSWPLLHIGVKSVSFDLVFTIRTVLKMPSRT